MASAIDRLLEDLLSSDEEEDQVAGPKPNGVAPAAAPEPHLAAGDRSADGDPSPLQSTTVDRALTPCTVWDAPGSPSTGSF